MQGVGWESAPLLFSPAFDIIDPGVFLDHLVTFAVSLVFPARQIPVGGPVGGQHWLKAFWCLKQHPSVAFHWQRNPIGRGCSLPGTGGGKKFFVLFGFSSVVAVFIGTCPVNAFACRNGQCVPMENVECDDWQDCTDASDEVDCGGFPFAGLICLCWGGAVLGATYLSFCVRSESWISLNAGQGLNHLRGSRSHVG